MPHADHNPRRVGSSAVPHVPPPRHGREQKRLILALCVGLTMLVIGGLYAATFRYGALFAPRAEAAPTWSALSEEFFIGVRPVVDQLGTVRESLTKAILAARVRRESFRLMQEKIAARSATATPETP